MKRIAYLHCFAGISGDMTLGALLDAGLPLKDLREQLATLKVPGFRVSRRKAEKHHITGTKAVVTTDEQHAHRHLHHILEIIGKSGIGPSAKKNAARIFTRLAKAEGRIHGRPHTKVHFHEVGALDAIVDIIGAAVGFELLGVDALYASPVALGTGTVRAAHGIIPVPAPATVELLKGFPTVRTGIPAELTTPTGAAVISTLASPGAPPPMATERIGYGAGGRDLDAIPNLLRLEIGTVLSPERTGSCVVIETNIDDMNPEITGHVTSLLMDAGALDVTLTPAYMKKGRPGVTLGVLCPPEKRRTLAALILRETTSIGVRYHDVERTVLKRRAGTRKTTLGNVNVKIVTVDGAERITPEYESCAAVARKKKLPLAEVYRRVEAEIRR